MEVFLTLVWLYFFFQIFFPYSWLTLSSELSYITVIWFEMMQKLKNTFEEKNGNGSSSISRLIFLKAHSSVWDNFGQMNVLLKWWKLLFISQAPFVLKIFKFLFWLFYSCRKKWLCKKDEVHFKIYDVTTRERNNCNKHKIQYFKK